MVQDFFARVLPGGPARVLHNYFSSLNTLNISKLRKSNTSSPDFSAQVFPKSKFAP